MNINAEALRFQMETQVGVGSTAGLGTQTGNTTNITVSGHGNNVIDVGQDNSGDQTIQDAADEGTNNNAASRVRVFGPVGGEMLN